MQIGGEDIENLFMNVILKKIKIKNTFPCNCIGHGLNKIWVTIWQDEISWDHVANHPT